MVNQINSPIKNYTPNTFQDKVLIDSKQRVDSRLLSNYTNTLTMNRSSTNTEFTFSNLKSNKQKSYQVYKSLLIKNRFTKSLLQSKEINYNNYTNIPQELANVNFPLWIEKYKKFLVLTLLEDIIREHDNNIISINQMLEFSNIQLISTLPEEEPESLNEILNSRFNDTTIFTKSTNTENSVKIFFGDTNRINRILQFIDYKLKIYHQKNNKNIYPSINKEVMYDTNSNEYISSILKKNNPFLKVSSITDYKEQINKNKVHLEENLVNLKQLLLTRILINEKLYPKTYMNSLTEKHSHLIIEYTTNRLRELKNNINIYRNNTGGKFIGEYWTSAFPTDSQLIAYISLQFLEDLYKDSYIRKMFLISFPLSPSKCILYNI